MDKRTNPKFTHRVVSLHGVILWAAPDVIRSFSACKQFLLKLCKTVYFCLVFFPCSKSDCSFECVLERHQGWCGNICMRIEEQRRSFEIANRVKENIRLPSD